VAQALVPVATVKAVPGKTQVITPAQEVNLGLTAHLATVPNAALTAMALENNKRCFSPS
jgi:hypothetical protein